jgi:hypothetical protein
MINITQIHNVAKRIRKGRTTRDLEPRFIDGLILEQEDHSTMQAPAGKPLGLLGHRNHIKPAQSGGQK